jgi:hypothetical protein
MGPIEKELRRYTDVLKTTNFDYNNIADKLDINLWSYHACFHCDAVVLALLDELDEGRNSKILPPVDADGIPWTGDEVKFISPDGSSHFLKVIRTVIVDCNNNKYPASSCSHVKPKRSLEEIARDIDKKFQNKDGWDVSGLISELHEYLADDSDDQS